MSRPSRRIIVLSFSGITLLAACGSNTRSTVTDSTAGTMHQPGSLAQSASDTRRGGAGMADASQMQVAVEANMRVMTDARGDQLMNMVPEHRQIVASMLGQMSREMGSVHTASSAAWMATRDSVANDLARFPTMSAQDLQSKLPGHAARLRRLMQMHGSMRGGMGRMMPNQ